MLSSVERRFGRNGVDVVRCGDQNGVNVLLLLQHLPEVIVAFGLAVSLLRLDILLVRLAVAVLGSLSHCFVHVAEIHVSKRDDILAAGHQFGRVGSALPSAADNCDVKFIARRHESRPAERVTRHDHCADGGSRSPRDEFPSCDLVSFHLFLPDVLDLKSQRISNESLTVVVESRRSTPSNKSTSNGLPILFPAKSSNVVWIIS